MSLLKYQHWHFLSLLILLVGVYLLVNNDVLFLRGEYLGVPTSTWFVLAMLSPVLHQIYVLLCWRLELLHKSISKTFGSSGFKLFKIGFALLIISRLFTIIILAFSNLYTLNLSIGWGQVLAVLFFIPSAYLFYSVKKYFGMDRAFGKDHFDPHAFKNKPYVKGGIFKYTSNGMYVYGFLILYIPGLILLSKAALLVALFNHLYIWVHYYFTEGPDMQFIYKE